MDRSKEREKEKTGLVLHLAQKLQKIEKLYGQKIERYLAAATAGGNSSGQNGLASTKIRRASLHSQFPGHFELAGARLIN
jgi:hypothetical protein